MEDDSTVLIVRHLPSVLTAEDRQDLFKHFGAETVASFGQSNRLKHTAFVSFASHAAAFKALRRLHQLDVLGSRLAAEFANSKINKSDYSFSDAVSSLKDTSACDSEDEKLKAVKDGSKLDKKRVSDEINHVTSKWGFEYPFNPKLRYIYPPPTVNILTNIANALACVPKFYVQVLHLMNKMNIPAPFSVVTPTPPIPEGIPATHEPGQSLEATEAEMDISSSEGSEIECGDEATDRGIARVSRKRKADNPEKPRMRHKLQKIVSASKPDVPKSASRPEEVFEKAEVVETRKIEFKLPDAIVKTLESNPKVVREDESSMFQIEAVEPCSEPQSVGGFGKIEPLPTPKEQASSEEDEDEWGATEFISSKKLRRGRLHASEIKGMSIFKNYSAGEPTTRLYIKNLSKHTTEKDLHHIYGKYVDWQEESEKVMFDIRLMKEGRMKGQAFITLPNVECAQDALRDTHGFVMHDKAFVVQFARSARPKEKTQ